MKDEKGSVIVIALGALFVIALAGFGVWRYLDTKKAEDNVANLDATQEITDIQQPATNSPETMDSVETPSGFVRYEHAAAGFSFSYPASWGNIEIKPFDSPNTDGRYLYGIFSKNPDVHFGGDHEDYSHDGRGYAPTDHPGYVQRNSRYYMYSGFGKTGKLTEIENATSLEKLQAANTTGLYQKEAFIGDEYDSRQKYDIVRFNLTRSPYFGVNLVLKVESADSETRKLFLEAAKTFTLE
jgi:hypothetical protein